jgi:hypothetical protein
MTKPIPCDPDGRNDGRAYWAATALRRFQRETGTGNETALSDLLCDLMHWCDRNHTNFDGAVSTARMHYEAETLPNLNNEDPPMTHSQTPVSPIDAANALMPRWMRNIRDFDALEIHPCAVTGTDSLDNPITEQCEPEDAHFWCVFGHLRTGGADDFEDFATRAEAINFRDRLIAAFPHLAFDRN